MQVRGKILTAALVIFFVSSPGVATTATVESNPTMGETCGESVAETSEREVSNQQLPILRISITPRERQIVPNQTEIFLVCIANPRRYNQTVRKPTVVFWHDGTERDAISVVGPDEPIRTDNHVGMQPLDTSWNDGEGRAVASGKLEPGEVIEYVVVVSKAPETGKRRIRANVTYHYFVNSRWKDFTVSETVGLNVVCPPSCAVSRGVEAVETFLREYAMFILTVVGTAVAIISVVVAVYGPQRVRNAFTRSSEGESQRERRHE